MRLYRVLASLAVWLGLFPWELLRIAVGRSSREALRQRLGLAPAARGGGAPLLVHAVSAGEAAAAEALAARWVERYPDVGVIVTAGTAEGFSKAAGLAARHPGVSPPLYLPWDRPAAVRRWLERVRPRAIAVVETEIWPGLILSARALGIPLALVSARLTPGDAARYRLARRFFADVLGSCAWIGAQDEESAALLRSIGGPPARIEVAGNLKLGGIPGPPVSPRLAASLSGEGPLLVAGSTHPPEERLLLRMLRSLLGREPRLRLVLVPRRPRRARRVAAIARAAGWKTELASAVVPGDNWSVLVVDSMGLLPSLYPFAELAFVGGSLARRGGHNPLEPAACGKPILMGPHTENFREIAQALESAGALRRARGLAHLEGLARRLLEDGGEERAAMSRAGKTFMASRRTAADRYVDALGRLANLSETAPRSAAAGA